MARVLVKDATTQLSTDIGIVTIPGEVKAYAGTAAPTGFLFCHGQAVSRTTYSALYAVLGNSHGSGDGSTTFNLPDYRGSFLRGLVNVTSSVGSGSASAGAVTFTGHGFNRTGFKVRFSAIGGLTLVATGVDYYAIVVNDNTLRFATTKANALAGTYLAVTGAAVSGTTATLVQWEDPDYGSREKIAPGGNATGLGAYQEDVIKGHKHIEGTNAVNGNLRYGYTTAALSNNRAESGSGTNFASYTSTEGGNETRSKNVLINYIIKY